MQERNEKNGRDWRGITRVDWERGKRREMLERNRRARSEIQRGDEPGKK